jgi:hypothetical protein
MSGRINTPLTRHLGQHHPCRNQSQTMKTEVMALIKVGRCPSHVGALIIAVKLNLN